MGRFSFWGLDWFRDEMGYLVDFDPFILGMRICHDGNDDYIVESVRPVVMLKSNINLVADETAENTWNIE